MSEMQPIEKKEDLEYFEDVLARTGTRRDDWYTNGTLVANALKIPNGYLDKVWPSIPHVRLIGMAGRPVNAVRKSDLEKWMAEHPKRVEQVKEEVKEALNGRVAAPASLVINEALPFVSKVDFDKLLHAEWATKAAIESLQRSVDANSSSTDANTKAIRDQITETRRIFEGDRK